MVRNILYYIFPLLITINNTSLNVPLSTKIIEKPAIQNSTANTIIDLCIYNNIKRSVKSTSLLSVLRVKVFNATFNNISVISWRSILLVEETGVPVELHRAAASYWQTLSHDVVSCTPLRERDSNWQRQWWYALLEQVVINPTTITTMRSRPRQSRLYYQS